MCEMMRRLFLKKKKKKLLIRHGYTNNKINLSANDNKIT